MKEIKNIREIKDNFVKMIADDWALVSAADGKDWNTMTISWGGVGELWGKDVVFVFILRGNSFSTVNPSLRISSAVYPNELSRCVPVTKTEKTIFPSSLRKDKYFPKRKISIILVVK